MGCFYPLKATQFPSGEILIHKRTPGVHQFSTPAHLGRDIKLPCGNCIGCKMQRTQEWATRCLHESQQHKDNCFLTLTIAEEHMSIAAPMGSLSLSTHQKFLKRLRATLGAKISFYMCGEYGEKLRRPHYHYLIFGYDFNDKVFVKTSRSGEKLYESPTLNRLWPYGKAWIGAVTYDSCAYVAGYIMKKYNGEKAEEHYRRQDEAGNDYWLTPEFNQMSRRPAIAHTWWKEFNQDVTTTDVVVRKNGGLMKPPRYYDKLLELMDPALYQVNKLKRELRANGLLEDNTPRRLADKEIVLNAKLKLKQRPLEQQHENDLNRHLRQKSPNVHQPGADSERQRVGPSADGKREQAE